MIYLIDEKEVVEIEHRLSLVFDVDGIRHNNKLIPWHEIDGIRERATRTDEPGVRILKASIKKP